MKFFGIFLIAAMSLLAAAAPLQMQSSGSATGLALVRDVEDSIPEPQQEWDDEEEDEDDTTEDGDDASVEEEDTWGQDAELWGQETYVSDESS
ncbi:hypothetical protein TruAng_004425 [Truncatella angustata]|nr:hypothetical protein TruAng_004425 [Truncatella angustata]